MTPCSGGCGTDLDTLTIRIVMEDQREVCRRCWVAEHSPPAPLGRNPSRKAKR